MRELWNLFVEATLDMFRGFAYFIKDNLMAFANILSVVLPYFMYIIGQTVVIERGEFAVGGELFLPIPIILFIYYFKSIANKTGKGNIIPIPKKRFTQIDSYGEVSVENDRLQELLLYIADLEDWLSKKGML